MRSGRGLLATTISETTDAFSRARRQPGETDSRQTGSARHILFMDGLVFRLTAIAHVPYWIAMTQVFSLAPAQGATSSLWMALLILPIFGITGYLAMAPRLIRFEVSPNQLRIRGDP